MTVLLLKSHSKVVRKLQYEKCYYARNRLINTEVVPDVPELDIVDLDPD